MNTLYTISIIFFTAYFNLDDATSAESISLAVLAMVYLCCGIYVEHKNPPNK